MGSNLQPCKLFTTRFRLTKEVTVAFLYASAAVANPEFQDKTLPRLNTCKEGLLDPNGP
jgi:hypothetical protein